MEEEILLMNRLSFLIPILNKSLPRCLLIPSGDVAQEHFRLEERNSYNKTNCLCDQRKGYCSLEKVKYLPSDSHNR